MKEKKQKAVIAELELVTYEQMQRLKRTIDEPGWHYYSHNLAGVLFLIFLAIYALSIVYISKDYIMEWMAFFAIFSLITENNRLNRRFNALVKLIEMGTNKD